MSVADVINEWDPISLFPYAPADEYQSEIHAIQQVMMRCQNAQTLSEKIEQIFCNAFGSSFVATGQECLNIANRLLMVATSPEDSSL